MQKNHRRVFSVSNGVQKIFAGCAEKGRLTKTQLTAANMKAALRDAGCVQFFPQGESKKHHQVMSPPFSFYGRPSRSIHYLPTLENLLIRDFTHVSPKVEMMRRGFGIVAEAVKMQRDDNTKTREVQALLGTAGSAFAVSFQMLARRSRVDISYGIEGPSGLGDRPLHQLPNFMRRPEGVKIAQRLFEEALKCN